MNASTQNLALFHLIDGEETRRSFKSVEKQLKQVTGIILRF